MPRYWDDYGYFVDSTLDGRRTIRATADVLCLDSLAARRGDWRGGGLGGGEARPHTAEASFGPEHPWGPCSGV